MKRTALIILVLSLITISTEAFASKLVATKVIDQNYIMVQFKDGDACFADTGTGPYAYMGDHYTGWDWVVSYTSALNLTNAVIDSNWVITSASDANYGSTGLNPTNCYRKSKLNGASEGNWGSYDWIYHIGGNPFVNGCVAGCGLGLVAGSGPVYVRGPRHHQPDWQRRGHCGHRQVGGGIR